MTFPRNIIYIGTENNKDYIYTLQGQKYWVDDVTEDGLVYIEYVDDWLPIFMSDKDLKIIRLCKVIEELNETIDVLNLYNH